MPTLTRGTAIDLARSGFSIPLDRWALATDGWWKQLIDTDIPIAPPACWLPVTLESDRSLLVKDEPIPALTLASDSPIDVTIDLEPAAVTIADEIIRVKVC